MEYEARSTSAVRPDWTYSVPPPQTLSALWMLERLAGLSVPLAGLALLAAARYFEWVTFY